jgi:hypothetical protein
MEDSIIEKKTLDDFYKSMKTTSYARFDAHRRCNRLNNSSLFALTSASLLLIFLSIINTYSSQACPFINKSHLEIFSILTSVIILVLSLVVSFASYSLKSERYFRSGNEIGELCDRIDFADVNNKIVINEIVEEYFMLRKHSENHQGYNYKNGRLERKRQIDDTILESDDLTIIEHLGYWAPIVGFYFISLSSLSVFIYAILKYAEYA